MNLCELCKSIKDLQKETINVLELYSGIGGMHYGLLNCGLTKLGIKLNVTAIDINPNANDVYNFNFRSSKVLSKNLASISVQEFDKLKIDICTMSPPCQPFTRQHTNQKFEEEDNRTESLHHLITNVFPNLTNKPKYFLIENVKNFEVSKTSMKLLKMFELMNYNYRQFLLQPDQFGIPNSRLRYYCLAKKDAFCFSSDELILKEYPDTLSNRSCPNCMDVYFLKDAVIIHEEENYELNKEKFKLNRIGDYLESGDLEQLKLKSETVQKYLPAIDVVNRNSQISCCFTSSYGHYLTGTGSFLLINDEEIALDRLIELKKNPEKASTISLKLRKFKPREIANLMGFPVDFQVSEQTTLRQTYKLLGNSVNVKVIGYLLKILLLNESSQ